MGVFFDYNHSDVVNHIQLIIMAYEEGAVLKISYPLKDVGQYYILYESTENSEITRYLESVPTENALNRRLSSLAQSENIEIIARGMFFPVLNAKDILNPLFLKIRELEEEIKLLKNPSSTLGPDCVKTTIQL